MSNRTTRFSTLWQRLTSPHARITNAVQQQRVRMLTGLTLVLSLLTVIAVPVSAIAGFRYLLPLLLSLLLFLVSYVTGRTRHAEWGGIVLVVGLSVLVIALLPFVSSPSTLPVAMVFVLVPILLSTLLVSLRGMLAVTALNLAGLVLLVVIEPEMTIQQALLPFTVVLIVAALTVAIKYAREQDIERMSRRSQDAGDQHSLLLEREARRLAAVAEVGRAITGIRDLDTLLGEVVNLIIQRFDFYHAQVFLIDEMGRYAVLRASTGEAGKQLLARGHRLAVGSQSVIGAVTAGGEPVIAADTDTDPIHRRNELLPNTRSEMALPLRIGGRVIGALDIQSVTPNAFQKEDIATFQAVADQLAIAIENARLFEQARRDLHDIEMLNRQLTGKAWRDYVSGRSSALPIGFRADAQGIQPITADGEGSSAEAQDTESTVSVPLRLRGETIGVIDLQPRDGSPPDEETRALLEAVAERVSLALDSSRLSEQSQRQVEREQLLSRLSAELQATTDLDTILRIVAREAGEALGTPRAFIHLSTEYGSGPQQDE